MKKKIVIFGMGYMWESNRSSLQEMYDIVAYIDNAWESKGSEVQPVEVVKEIDYDYIFITPKRHGEMYKQLLDMGIDRGKIRLYGLEKGQSIMGYDYYGQHCDDLIIAAIFQRIGIHRPSYMDIGANNPYQFSNTATLYKHGCRGINIEADPLLLEELKNARPKDINLAIGIALTEGIIPFYKFYDSCGRNTFDKDEAEKWKDLSVTNVVELPVTTLKKVVDEYCPDGFPDFLSIDIEGLDYDVLDGYDLKNNGPKVICVEVRPNETGKFDKMLDEKNYYRFCRIGENNIYVKKEFAPRVSHCKFS